MSHCREKTVSITGGFFLLISWFALENGWKLLLTVLSAAALHELGHLLVLRYFGVSVSAFRMTAFGAEMRLESSRLSYGRELAAVLAGPAVNFFCGLAAALAARHFRWPELYLLAGAHLVLCWFNLLPIRPLDGGRALEILTVWIRGPAAGESLCRTVGTVFALLLCVWLFWLVRESGGSLWLLPAAGCLLFAALRESGAAGDRPIACPGTHKRHFFAK